MVSTESMASSMNSERRLLYIIDRLMKEELSNSQLANEIFGTDSDNTRTKVRNTLKVIAEHFGERLVSTRKGYHKLIELPKNLKELYNNTSNEMIELFEFVSLFDSKKLDFFEQSEPELVRKIKKDTNTIYHMFDKPFEEIENIEIWQQLKKAVKERRYISLAYEKNKLLTYNCLKPLKIVFANNNWYLATLLTEATDDYDFTLLRINHIKHLKLEATNFQREPIAIKHLQEMQSLFERYNIEKYTVTVKIDKSVASYFKQKKYLRSQKIVEEKKDASLIVEYTINNTLEMLPLIKQWLPHIHVIEPQSLKSEIEQILRDYIQ